MVSNVRFVSFNRVVKDRAHRRVAAYRFHARPERVRARGDVRKIAAGGGPSVINGAQRAVEKRAPAVLAAHDLVIRIAGFRIDVLSHQLLHRDAKMRGDRLDFRGSQFDDHSPATVRALRAVDLPLDLMRQNLEGLDGNVVGMEVAAEVEILRFLRFGQAADLVGICDQAST